MKFASYFIFAVLSGVAEMNRARERFAYLWEAMGLSTILRDIILSIISDRRISGIRRNCTEMFGCFTAPKLCSKTSNEHAGLQDTRKSLQQTLKIYCSVVRKPLVLFFPVAETLFNDSHKVFEGVG